MDYQVIDKRIREIVECREELRKIDYSNPRYDEVEERLHDMEDDFQDEYGEPMEKILQEVHDKHCPDSDVLLPIAYVAHRYKQDGKDGFDVPPGEGVSVDVDKYPGKDTRLAIVPSPLRIILNIGEDKQEVLWKAGK